MSWVCPEGEERVRLPRAEHHVRRDAGVVGGGRAALVCRRDGNRDGASRGGGEGNGDHLHASLGDGVGTRPEIDLRRVVVGDGDRRRLIGPARLDVGVVEAEREALALFVAAVVHYRYGERLRHLAGREDQVLRDAAVVRGIRAAAAGDHDGQRQRVREGVAQRHRHVEAVALCLGVAGGIEGGGRRLDQLDRNSLTVHKDHILIVPKQ